MVQAIDQFFGSWYTAVGSASATAGLNIDEIVQLIDPPSDTTLIMDDILIALTGIFAVAPGLGLNVGSMLDHAVEDAVKVSDSLRTGLKFVENAIIGFPQIGRFLYPIDTPASTLLQIADLKSQLSDLIATVQNNLNKTVSSVMADASEFLAFAKQGNFTGATRQQRLRNDSQRHQRPITRDKRQPNQSRLRSFRLPGLQLGKRMRYMVVQRQLCFNLWS